MSYLEAAKRSAQGQDHSASPPAADAPGAPSVPVRGCELSELSEKSPQPAPAQTGHAVNTINAVNPSFDLSPAEEAAFEAVIRQVEAKRWGVAPGKVLVWSPLPGRGNP